MPKLSIIVTIYKYYDYLSDCIQSVYNQTYKDFELIIVNDGSDNEIDKEIKKNKYFYLDNFKYYNVKRLKRSAALNFAINKSNSDIICILDSDDLWHPKKLEAQLFYFENFDLDFLCTKSPIFINNQYKVLNSKKRLLKKINKSDLYSKNIIAHSSVMYKKKFAKYNEDIFTNVDIDVWLRLISKNVNLYFLNLSLTYIRKHKNQYFPGTSKMDKFKYFINSIKIRINNSHKFYDYTLVFVYAFRTLLTKSLAVFVR